MNDHVVTSDNAVVCLNCGDEYRIAMPCPIPVYTAIAKAYEQEHRRCKPSEAGEAKRNPQTLQQWRDSADTGLSSKALYRHFSNIGHGSVGADHPWDPSDFGRCYRLLKIAPPDWRQRIGEMAKYGASWAALSAAWDELEALYEAEFPSGRAPRLYARMRALLGRGAP